MQGTEQTVSAADAAAVIGGTERRRRAWRHITVRQVTRLCDRANGTDPAARDAAARAARLAALLELDERGALPAR